MIKLSKTGWNNVIIFAVMGFILLINATNKDVFSQRDKENSSMAKEQPLIGEEQVILTLLINNVIEIKRIGKSWQAVPAKINSQALEQMMMSWQKSVGTRLEESPTFTREFSLDVKLDIAGKALPLALNFYATDEQLLIFNQTSQQWLVMPIALYNQLFPQEIFVNK